MLPLEDDAAAAIPLSLSMQQFKVETFFCSTTLHGCKRFKIGVYPSLCSNEVSHSLLPNFTAKWVLLFHIFYQWKIGLY